MMDMTTPKPKRPHRRPRMTAEERREAMARRDAAVRTKMAIYSQFREALILISGLPRAADMAQLVRLYDRSHFVMQRIPGIAAWMREFEDAWTAGHEDQIPPK
jgi:hypothetical protein